MAQPSWFIDNHHPTHVCKFRKAIYGLKQASRSWYHKLCHFFITFGFTNSYVDISLFVCIIGSNMIYLYVYVDDTIIIDE